MRILTQTHTYCIQKKRITDTVQLDQTRIAYESDYIIFTKKEKTNRIAHINEFV